MTEELIERLKEYPGLIVVSKDDDGCYWPVEFDGMHAIHITDIRGVERDQLCPEYTPLVVLE